MNDEMIEAFLREMRQNHGEEIASVDLPEGTEEYVQGRIAAGDAETILFMLKLGYLMGVQTGFAAGQAGEAFATTITVPGPLEA
ncbi:MAG TPA: hypothetical protein VF168_06390 [Trueperaceae bacterium]